MRLHSVGVGVVVFRSSEASRKTAEVLLIRRANAPSTGRLCFPGGRLEWGETLAQCAVREVLEETGVAIESQAGAELPPLPPPRGFPGLSHPWPLVILDGLFEGKDGGISHHYTIIEVRTVPYCAVHM